VKHPSLPILILAASLLAGSVFAAPADAQRTAVAVNIPSPPPPELRPLKADGPAPLAPDALRVGAPAAGQTVAEDYRIGPQDLIEVQVYGLEGLKREGAGSTRAA